MTVLKVFLACLRAAGGRPPSSVDRQYLVLKFSIISALSGATLMTHQSTLNCGSPGGPQQDTLLHVGTA